MYILYKDCKLRVFTKKAPFKKGYSIIDYVIDEKLEELRCEILYNERLISKGIILDFYKEFENIKDIQGNIETQILTFKWQGKSYTKNTLFGNKIQRLKYFNNPPIDKLERENLINEIVSAFNNFIKTILYEVKVKTDFVIGYVPSSSNLPFEIAKKLSEENNIELIHFISKQTELKSKNLTYSDNKLLNIYEINFHHSYRDKTFLIVDDVVGTGATLCEIMYKINYFNKRTNYFFAVVKDVKR